MTRPYEFNFDTFTTGDFLKLDAFAKNGALKPVLYADVVRIVQRCVNADISEYDVDQFGVVLKQLFDALASGISTGIW